MIQDNCNPVYNQTFEYLVSETELHKQKLIATVKTKVKFSLHNNVIGQVSVCVCFTVSSVSIYDCGVNYHCLYFFLAGGNKFSWYGFDQ